MARGHGPSCWRVQWPRPYVACGSADASASHCSGCQTVRPPADRPSTARQCMFTCTREGRPRPIAYEYHAAPSSTSCPAGLCRPSSAALARARASRRRRAFSTTRQSRARAGSPRRRVGRSGAKVSIASAVIGPTSGMVWSRLATSASFAALFIFRSSSATRAFSPAICAIYIWPKSGTPSGKAVPLSSIASARLLNCTVPVATNPCSARCPRVTPQARFQHDALVIWVR
jgi:hypothetical protein